MKSAACLVLAAALPTATLAAGPKDSMLVSATVLASCTISSRASAVAIDYDSSGLLNAPYSPYSVSCSDPATYDIHQTAQSCVMAAAPDLAGGANSRQHCGVTVFF